MPWCSGNQRVRSLGWNAGIGITGAAIAGRTVTDHPEHRDDTQGPRLSIMADAVARLLPGRQLRENNLLQDSTADTALGVLIVCS